ncbi:YCF48-related protein [Variovorax sp. J22R133]|uniref:WD40/YVTN/BNR-like repeat-containing protein n=1 Tax=Variovorax brevis TaxID=3053503 RepID=UPI002574E16B|nr:YCF48-related protein [Variovorax sp. J22R133]MDM0110824.1 YCF48-related protein [Variovorax sp. J22R133]
MMSAKRVTRGGRALALALSVAACAAGVAAWSAQAAPDKGWRDVLDTPAVKSPLASRALLNGLASAGSRIVAVGQRGHIVYSDDAGKSWQQAEVPVSSDLVAVTFPDERNGWAVGHDGIVLRSTDAGLTWTRKLDGRQVGEVMSRYYAREAEALSASDPKRAAALLEEARRFEAQGAENPFLDVWFRDATNGYVVGAFGLVLQTADGGATWEPRLHAVDNPKGLHLYAVRGIGSDIYIAGEQGLLLKLAQGDTRFRALELPYKGTLFGVTGNAGSLLAYGLRGTVLRSTDGGRSWQQTPTGLQVGLTAGTRQDDGRIVIVSQAGHILTSNDEGATFKAASTERTVPAAAVVVPAKGTVVIAGPRGAQTLALP